MTTAFAKDMKKLPKRKPRRTGPVWKGPEQDGVTFSLLSRFLCCRERFRLLVIEGLKPADKFDHKMEFGNMWHVCEEGFAARKFGEGPGWFRDGGLTKYCRGLCEKYPLQQEQVNHWYEIAKALFPYYAKHWSEHPDVKERTPLLQEQVFDVPYQLPSGRTVRLRGKWDSVDLIGGKEYDLRGAAGKNAPGPRGKVKVSGGIYLQENKTKSSIDGAKITRQLSFDLQTMMYLVALQDENDDHEPKWKLPAPILGVRYNVVRRSAHKSVESMLKKLEEDRAAGRIGEWFARWKVDVTTADVARFRRECLNPVLETLCNWWEWVKDCGTDADDHNPFDLDNLKREEYRVQHWRHPFGVYNVLDEGGSSDLDAYLETGSEVCLRRTDNLFEELT